MSFVSLRKHLDKNGVLSNDVGYSDANLTLGQRLSDFVNFKVATVVGGIHSLVSDTRATSMSPGKSYDVDGNELGVGDYRKRTLRLNGGSIHGLELTRKGIQKIFFSR